MKQLVYYKKIITQNMAQVQRFLGLLIILLLVSACGDNNTREVVSGDTSPYQLLISSSDMTPLGSRLVLTLWDGPERLTGAQALDVELYSISSSGDATAKVWEGASTSYEMNGLQYWISYPDFPAAGNYGVRAIVTNQEGKRIENQAILAVKEAAEAPDIGDIPPRSNTRTLDEAPIEELTSAGPYIERFYEMSVADAIDGNKPAIIAFSTPAYCTSALCTPVMQTLETVSQELGDQVNVVHVEVWRDFANQKIEPAIEEWNLPSEPWLFILNADGTIGARLDGPVSPQELREVMADLIG
ncbi:MAG: TlpA family protein disulfide reductase [Ardenticatenaceae bacterium]